MRVFTGSALVGVWAVLAAALPTVAISDPCPALAVGVHEVTAGTSKILTSVAKATPLSDDEGSYGLAEAEARLEARRGLMNYLSPGLKQTQFSGLIDVSVCRSNGEVFATLRLDEANVRRAAKMQDMIRESLTKNPTPKP
mgnify:CR=1 FL=1